MKMDEYIERKKAIELIQPHVKPQTVYGEGYLQAIEHATDILKLIPSADVQPVKHGKWEETHISLVKYIPEDEKEEGHSFYMAELKCSCCERYNAVTFALTLNKPDFCQLCGARMDSDDDETL
jgi:hypothetical protein